MIRVRSTFQGLLALALLATPAGASLPDETSLLARADEAWTRRAASANAGRVASEQGALLVAAYERAVEADPTRLEARWKLLRALHFHGEFASDDDARRKAIFERAADVADEGLAALAARTGPLEDLSDAALLERLASSGVSAKDAAGVQFWSAVAWGSWSRTHGLLEAVRKGVANRVYEHALLAHRIDPDFEQGGPLRLLARLHGTLPRVPFLSGWVDRDRAVPLAEEAAARWPGHPGNHYLVALTWLDLAPARRAEALAALEDVVRSQPRPAREVEDAAIVRAAAERLGRERTAAS